MELLACKHGQQHLGVMNLFRGDLEPIPIQHHEVRSLAHRDGARLLLRELSLCPLIVALSISASSGIPSMSRTAPLSRTTCTRVTRIGNN